MINILKTWFVMYLCIYCCECYIYSLNVLQALTNYATTIVSSIIKSIVIHNSMCM